jgi:hypothetical protein
MRDKVTIASLSFSVVLCKILLNLNGVKCSGVFVGEFCREVKLIFNEVSQHAPISSLAVIARPTADKGNAKMV